MNSNRRTPRSQDRPGTDATAYGTGSRVLDTLLWIVGGVAAFLGLFVLLGPQDQYLGLGGDASWKVADIHVAWGYGFLAGGVVALLGALVLTLRMRKAPRVETSPLSALVVHSVVFAAVNALVWAQDLATGGGLEYAYWLTAPWGIGLLTHALGYARDRSDARGRQE